MKCIVCFLSSVLLLACSAKYAPTGQTREGGQSTEEVSYSVVKVTDPTPAAPDLVLKCSARGSIVKTTSSEYRVRRQISPLLTVLAPLAAIASGALLYSKGYVVAGRDVGGAAVAASMGMLGYNTFNRNTEWKEAEIREPTAFVPTTPLTVTLKGTKDTTKLVPDRNGKANVNLLDYSRFYPRLNPFVFEVGTPTGERVAEFAVNSKVINDATSVVDRDIPETGVSQPDAVAVVAGVAEYQKAGVPPVEFALRDAETVKTYLIKVLGYRPENIIYLANPSKADFERVFGTPSDYRGELYNFVKPATSEVFIYYSGHGAPDIESRTGYFVPADCSPDYVRLNGYALRTFYENLTHIQSQSTTVIIDACFSGQYDAGVLAKAASGITVVPRLSLLPSNINVLTSCDTNQVSSWYSDKRHGLFTFYFLKALQQTAAQTPPRGLTLGELTTYVTDSVGYVARRMRGRTQTPTFSGDLSKFILPLK